MPKPLILRDLHSSLRHLASLVFIAGFQALTEQLQDCQHTIHSRYSMVEVLRLETATSLSHSEAQECVLLELVPCYIGRSRIIAEDHYTGCSEKRG